MADLLFEIGAEEIPAGFAPAALQQMAQDLSKALDDARLGHGEVRAVGTPRRLAVWAREVERRQGDAISQALGPPVAQAFDAAGNPTPAAAGFARSQGVEVSALERVETPKGLRLAVTKVEKGRKAAQVVPAILDRLVAGLRFKKAMRSGSDPRIWHTSRGSSSSRHLKKAETWRFSVGIVLALHISEKSSPNPPKPLSSSRKATWPR